MFTRSKILDGLKPEHVKNQKLKLKMIDFLQLFDLATTQLCTFYKYDTFKKNIILGDYSGLPWWSF